MCAFGFRLGFGHIRTSFSLAVPLRAFAVVDIGRGIQPDLTRSAARALEWPYWHLFLLWVRRSGAAAGAGADAAVAATPGPRLASSKELVAALCIPVFYALMAAARPLL